MAKPDPMPIPRRRKGPDMSLTNRGRQRLNRQTRLRIEALVETLIAILDESDGDPDEEVSDAPEMDDADSGAMIDEPLFNERLHRALRFHVPGRTVESDGTVRVDGAVIGRWRRL
ncbi:hypothetical protein [Zavarzinia aquatilis]|nr:hypothetical protein [Zavarzinia aquatilis]